MAIHSSEDGKYRILFLSYGKDSMACLGAIDKLGLPLDHIVHVEVWATDDIPADLPPLVEFKAKADAIIKERYGYTVRHVTAMYPTEDGYKKATYENQFHRTIKEGENAGRIYGFPFRAGPWCNGLLKVQPMTLERKNIRSDHMPAKRIHRRKAIRENEKVITYIGYGINECKRTVRLGQHSGTVWESPLVLAGWDEAYATEWCRQNGLLAPIYYDGYKRQGCWFCHNQDVNQMRMLRENYPEYWNLLLKWDSESPTFWKDEFRVHDYEVRFRAEDEGRINPNKRFTWDMLEDELHLSDRWIHDPITRLDDTPAPDWDGYKNKTIKLGDYIPPFEIVDDDFFRLLDGCTDDDEESEEDYGESGDFE